MNLNFRFWSQCEWVKIEQVGFNRKRIASERGAATYVSDGIETFVAHASSRDVDAVCRNHLLITTQVDRRHGVLRSIAAPSSRGGENRERTAQQVTSATHPASGQEPANVAARDRFSTQAHFGISNHFKAHGATQVSKRLYIPGRLVTEMKVVAFVNFDRVQPVLEDLASKLFRRHERQVATERQKQNRVHSGSFQQAQLLGSWCEQLESTIGAQNSDRVRLKRHGNRSRISLARPGDNFPKHMSVSTVDAVKVADTDDGRTKIAWNFFELVTNLHRSII